MYPNSEIYYKYSFFDLNLIKGKKNFEILKGFSAVGAVRKFPGYRLAAFRTAAFEHMIGFIQFDPTFIKDYPAVAALEEGDALFHREKRNKKGTQILVDPLFLNLYPAADRTGSGIFIQDHGFWLNTSDKEKHHISRSFC